jgi:glycerol-3-phosphate dehydrogenase
LIVHFSSFSFRLLPNWQKPKAGSNRVKNKIFDIAIIGGGINGCGIARDAAGRGLSVALFEKNDLASGTSSSSTKLIHGGLRYLEHYEFRLVRESLKEREVLLSMAPHISWPLRFVLPHLKGLRPAWLIRLGLFLYDHLGGREHLPSCTSVNLKSDPVGAPLKDHLRKGFEYSDCWVNDARLVTLNAMDAADRGVDINVRTEVTSAKRNGNLWEITVLDQRQGETRTVQAKSLINAAGPWVADVLNRRVGSNSNSQVRLVKGSHIVVPKQFDHDRAYIFQNADQRIIFAIPYEQDFTLIGTTDVDYEGDPSDVAASAEEIAYLCKAASEYFVKQIDPAEVVWTYSGVRPLYDDGESSAQKATRDYVLELDGNEDEAPLMNIFGGKITTYRCLAEDALGKLSERITVPDKTWTAGATLPGGDFPIGQFDQVYKNFCRSYPDIDPGLIQRLARGYGTRTSEILRPGLGHHFGGGLYQSEVNYLIKNEWATTGDDVLWRRTKLGLRLNTDESAAFSKWMDANAAIMVE